VAAVSLQSGASLPYLAVPRGTTVQQKHMAESVAPDNDLSVIEEHLLLDFANDRTPNSSIESTPEPASAEGTGAAHDSSQPQKRKGGRKPVSQACLSHWSIPKLSQAVPYILCSPGIWH